MNGTLTDVTASPLVLAAERAADLMAPDPVSIRDDATLAEVLAVLTDRGLGAVPVIDDAGRAVGVVSQADVVAHEREGRARAAGDVGRSDPTRARDLMTPAVFSVFPETPAAGVVGQMVAMKLNRLFVVDHDGVIVGMVTALDVLRHLTPAP